LHSFDDTGISMHPSSAPRIEEAATSVLARALSFKDNAAPASSAAF
jgi:hypothetical protein